MDNEEKKEHSPEHAPTVAQEAPSPEINNTPSMSSHGGSKPFGPTIGIVVIVLVFVLGGLYFWGKQLVTNEQTPEKILGTPDQQTESLDKQGTSDEISTIEEDLNDTNLDNLDSELNQIENELNNL